MCTLSILMPVCTTSRMPKDYSHFRSTLFKEDGTDIWPSTCGRYWKEVPNFSPPIQCHMIYEYRSTQSPKMDIIPHSSNVQDLGITKSSDCTFNAHINSLSKRKNFTGWILRTFISCDKLTMLTLFKALVLSRLDYGSQPRAYLRGGFRGFKPPRNFQIFFWKSEGKEIERKRKKRDVGGRGLPLNIFLGLIFFRVGLRYFQGGLRNYRGIEKFSGGVEKFSWGVEKFSGGVEKFSGGVEKFSGGVEKFSGGGVEKFSGGGG